jgi:GDP-4-dehydro-6-deoxy-D-mannose reductase
MKKVLVTGANGFVGNHLVKELGENGIEVVGIGGGSINTNKSPYISDYKVLELMDPEAVKQIDFTDIDGVIHLAGLAAPAPSFDKPLEYINTNMGIESNLFEAALAQNAKPKFVIVSSGSLYDPKATMPFNEDSSVCPNSPYAVSKIGQEQLAQYYGIRGFDCIIVRPFNHIGPGQNLGFIVPDLTKQVIDFEKGDAKEIVVGNLDAKRDYTDVRDIVKAYRLLLEKGKSGETYNICSGTALSGHEILASILKAAGCEPTIVKDEAKTRPSDRPVLYGSHQKITDDTGWKPEIDIEQTIQDVVADWRDRK